MMRHADQRRAFRKPELPRQEFWRAGHLVEATPVEGCCICEAHQLQALRRFLQYRARHCARQRRIIPTREPGVDVAEVAPDAAQRRNHRVDRRFRIFGGVLVAGEALFLVVDDQARAFRLRHLDQRHAGIVRAGKPEADEKHGLAAAKFFPHLRQSLIGKIRAELMEAGSSHRKSGQPACKAKAGRCEPGVSRTNTFVRQQSLGPVIEAETAPSIIPGARQQCRFRRAE